MTEELEDVLAVSIMIAFFTVLAVGTILFVRFIHW